MPHNFSPYSAMQLENGYLKPFLKFDEEKNLRQKKPKFFARNGAAIYIFTKKSLQKNTFYGEKVLPYFMDEKASLDIDTEWDFKLAEIIINEEKNENTL